MLGDTCLMRLLFLVALIGCTKPNPRDCADGTCTDPAFPFCDVGGEVDGQANTCIAVECTPTEFRACRDDLAITCNAAGSDFDLLQCPHGCNDTTGGCKNCAEDVDCSTAAPVCDLTTNTCRGCQEDDECDSRACDVDVGACFDDAAIVYTAPGASGTACSLSDPCPLTTAVTTAGANPLRSTIRMLPGTYDAQLSLTSTTLSIIGSSAKINGNGPDVIRIGNASNITIRGLEIDLSRGALQCNPGPDTTTPSLHLRDLTIHSPTAQSRTIFLNCNATMDRLELLSDGTALGTGLGVTGDTTISIDRCHFNYVGLGSTPIFSWGAIQGNTGHVLVTNSLFENYALSAQGSMSFEVAFNTVVLNSNDANPLTCGSSSLPVEARVENNIFIGTTSDSLAGTKCTATHNVLFPQGTPIPGTNLVADPRFENPAVGDFHLTPSSPAVDAAVPAGALTTDHDFEGKPRTAPFDIGALELQP